MMTSLQTMSITPKGMLRSREIRGVNPKDCDRVSMHATTWGMTETHIDNQRTENTDTTLKKYNQLLRSIWRINEYTHIGDVLEYREHKV